MPEHALSRTLQELTPEPPHPLGDLVPGARRRQRQRLAAALVGPAVLLAGTALLIPHGHHPTRPLAVERSPSAAPSRPTPPVPAPSVPPVTDMHSTSHAAGPVTEGYGDVNGDGRPDHVTVSTGGEVTVSLEGGPTLHAVHVPGRLQGIADLFSTGGRQVLVNNSASGCCGYRANAGRTNVLTLVNGVLTVVRDDGGSPLLLQFSLGRGEQHSGFRCRASGAVDETSFMPGGSATTWTLQRATITLDGGTAHVTEAPPETVAEPSQTDFDQVEGAHDCPGLSTDGFAAP